ncbi:MAG: hypothetical protein KA408_11070 [Flavobacteriales bacterium]|nr:hypothetical protein [Flavobacteriales bacterium]
MIPALAKWIVLLFGVFILAVGFLMLIDPEKARSILKKAGSTTIINCAEITIRLIPATAMIVVADACKYPEAFNLFGWIMVITSMVLYAVPRKMHHAFSLKVQRF